MLVQTPLLRDAGSLGKIFAPKLADDAPELEQVVRDAGYRADAIAYGEMQAALEARGWTIVTTDSALHAVDELVLGNPDTVITEDLIRRFRLLSDADALVRFRLTDYGVTPKAWRSAYITFEVVSTLAIAGAAYAYPKTRAIAGAYLLEESVEEFAEGVAGFWALDLGCRPVRIESEMVDLRTGVHSSATNTGLSDFRLSYLWRDVPVPELEVQLRESAREASVASVRDLQGEGFTSPFCKLRLAPRPGPTAR